MPVESRTQVIMLTDVCGFTAKTSRMSRKAMMAMVGLHDELVRPIFAYYGGRVVKTIGDSFLSVFESPTDAVLCAIQIQHVLRMYNRERPDEGQLHVRVALNAGEVQISEDGDVFGEAVNVAARVEGITDRDEIFFTEPVYLTINRNEVPKTLLVQNYSFKGIEEETKVYKVLQSEDDETYRRIINTKIETSEQDLKKVGTFLSASLQKKVSLAYVLAGVCIAAVVVLAVYFGMRREDRVSDPQKSAEMYEYAEEYADENPDDYDASIAGFEKVLKYAKDTKYELMAENKIRELEKGKSEAVQPVMAGLHKKASTLAKSDKYEEAAAVYGDYTGELAEETKDARREAIEKLVRAAEDKGMAVERAKWVGDADTSAGRGPEVPEGDAGTKTVAVQGKALLSLGDIAWEKALENALQKAVMQYGGAAIDGKDIVEKHVTDAKPSMAQCTTYINSWRIIRETRDEENLILNVQVNIGRDLEDTIRRDLLEQRMAEATLEQLYDWIGRPRVLVDIDEKIDNIDAKTQISQIEIERLLKKRGVDIYEKKQLARIKARRKKLVYDDLEQVRVLNEDFGIQLVIEGTCTSKYRGEVKLFPELPPVKDYNTTLAINIYRTTSGWKFTPHQYDDTGPRTKVLGDSGALGAATKSIKYVLDKNIDTILETIIDDWRNAAVNPRTIEVTVSGLTSNELDGLIDYLLKNKRVKSVPRTRIRFARNVAGFEVRFKGDQRELEQAMKAYGIPGKAGKRLNLVLAEEDHISYRIVSTGKPAKPIGIYEISIKGVALAQVKEFENHLADQGASARRVSFQNGRALLEVKHPGALAVIASDIVPRFTKPKLVVVGLSTVRLDLWTEESWQQRLKEN